MVICGIIVEYNPFHNGHLYHIKQAKKLTQCDVLIAIMSPTFMQRGEPAIIDKFTRAKVALQHEVDLIIELPSIYAIQSANHFAAGALKLLNECGVNYLVFGSESNNLNVLCQAAQISTSRAYQTNVAKLIKNGQRYATACNLAFAKHGITGIKQANDILGLAYIQEIYKNNYSIKPISIKRTNDYLDTEINNSIASATAIRHAVLNTLPYQNTTPLTFNLERCVFLDDFFILLKYRLSIMSLAELQQIHGISEGLEYLLKKSIVNAKDINHFINLVSSKRYPKTRIQRIIIYILLNLTKSQLKKDNSLYIRVLGMNKNGQQYLKNLKSKSSLTIITSFAQLKNPILEFEHTVTKVYALAKPTLHDLVSLEYQQPTIIYDKSNNCFLKR